MTKTTDKEKLNFLAWYEFATNNDIEIAKRNNINKYREFIAKYKTEIEEIDRKKSTTF